MFVFRAKRNFQHDFYRQPLQCLNYMFENNIACDVTLLVQGQEIPCHKVILAAHSTVFCDLFDNDCQLRLVNIEDISYDVMQTIIR